MTMTEKSPSINVTLSTFEIGKYPITQQQWQDIMGENPSHFSNCPDCPVENVSWNDIQKFLKKLNVRYPGKNYRLPTEAEWEFAARGGNQSQEHTYSGSNDPDEVGWYWKNSGDQLLEGEWDRDKITRNNCRTHPVGKKHPNELGIYDLSGNVWEWCQDWYGTYSKGPETHPQGPQKGDSRVLRGGSWYNYADHLRVSNRHSNDPSRRSSYIGFRLARTP